MKTLMLLLSILSFSTSTLSAQTWNTKIDYENTDYLQSKPGLIKTIDGNYLFLYGRYDEPALDNNIFTHALAKYNTQGELLWEKTYDHPEYIPPSNGGLNPKGMVQIPNENIVVAGRVGRLFIGYIYVTNNDGDSLLYRTYPKYKLFHRVVWHGDDQIVVRAIDTSDLQLIVRIDTNSGDILNENQDIGGGIFPK